MVKNLIRMLNLSMSSRRERKTHKDMDSDGHAELEVVSNESCMMVMTRMERIGKAFG